MRCGNNTYGPHCHLQCECGDYPCDHVTGVCDCPLGYHGPKCEHSESAHEHSHRRCECYNGGVCDAENGRCHCAPGHLDPTCQQEHSGISPENNSKHCLFQTRKASRREATCKTTSTITEEESEPRHSHVLSVPAIPIPTAQPFTGCVAPHAHPSDLRSR